MNLVVDMTKSKDDWILDLTSDIVSSYEDMKKLL